MPSIGLIANPHSGKNKRSSKRIDTFRQILGSAGTLIVPESLSELDQEVLSLKDSKIDILCINGGDGTIHKTITSLFNAYGDQPWPKIAILKGGTMNNIARNIGIPLLKGANSMLQDVIEADSYETIVKHPLIVDEKYAGFIYGTSGISAYLEEYYEGDNPSVWKAAKIAILSILSALVNGTYVKKIFASRPITIDVDGQKGNDDHYTNMGISTLTDLGFYLRPFYQTRFRPDIAHLITMNCSPLYIVFALPQMWMARPSNKSYIEDMSGQVINLTFQGQQSFTLDGDLYPVEAQQRIRVGPPIEFIVRKK
jgi:diacylglycerol kinase (ATP)